jgi:hypothetical protein
MQLLTLTARDERTRIPGSRFLRSFRSGADIVHLTPSYPRYYGKDVLCQRKHIGLKSSSRVVSQFYLNKER